MLNFHLDALAQTVHFRLIVPRHQIDFDVPCARTHQKMLPYSRLEVRPELIHEVEKNLSPTLLLLIPESIPPESPSALYISTSARLVLNKRFDIYSKALFIPCQKFKGLLLWLRVSHGSDCGHLCQMNTDGRELFSGSGPGSRGAAPSANVFIYL